MLRDPSRCPDDAAGENVREPGQELHAKTPRPKSKRQPHIPKNRTTEDVWLDLLAEVIVAEVLDEEKSETPNQAGGARRSEARA